MQRIKTGAVGAAVFVGVVAGVASAEEQTRRGFGVQRAPAPTSVSAPAPAPAPAPATDGGGFVDEAIGRGLLYESIPMTGYGRGVTLADLDADGDLDVVLTGRADDRVCVFENDGTGHFVERSEFVPVFDVAVNVIAADFDGDGDSDLYVGRWMAPARLLLNDGDFRFTDASAAWQLDTGAWGAGGAAAADIDGDGDIDLLAGNYTGPSFIYRNLGDRFEELAVEQGVDQPGMPFYQSTFVDYDHDGDLDVYHGSDRGELCGILGGYRSIMLANDGLGNFTDVTDETNTEACISAMCIAVGDLDRDGLNDIFSTGLPTGHALMRNLGTGTFERAEFDAGVAGMQSGWGSLFLDHDNDGWLDLFVAHNSGTNHFYPGGPDWPLTEQAVEVGLETDKTIWTNAAGDIDGDGRIDLLGGGVWTGNIVLKVNHSDAANRFVRFRVSGLGRLRDVPGASVRILADDVWRTRPIIAGGSFRGQSELVAHFGLAAAPAADEVVVTWPGGVTRTLGPAPADHTWTIPHPATLGDVDVDGLRDLADFAAHLACRTGDAPGSLAPGCERLDFDGDFDVDDDDLAALLAIFDGPLEDCDGDGTIDLLQIAAETAADLNGDGVIDGCQTSAADVNVDFAVNAVDLAAIVSAWGTPVHDLDGDGTTGFAEILMVLAAWG